MLVVRAEQTAAQRNWEKLRRLWRNLKLFKAKCNPEKLKVIQRQLRQLRKLQTNLKLFEGN